MTEEWVRKLADGETLSGEEARLAFAMRGWRLMVRIVLVHLERGDVEQAIAILEELLIEDGFEVS